MRKRGVLSVFLLILAGVTPLASTETGGGTPFLKEQRGWWAFRPIARPVPPSLRDARWVRNEIDRFIQDRLSREDILPSVSADKVTLIRRVTVDLTGLLPSPQEVETFVKDESPDAFEKVVDRLLASPRYGERWGRHWLDLARYSDSEGFKNDEPRPHIWRYRDYVIDSFNQDKPYDRFIREQIAGDEIYPDDPAAFIATGFNRHFADDSDARNLAQRRQEILDDITDTIGATFLGLTLGCARCHDHKFDPISQADYYQLQAFFANVRVEDTHLPDKARDQYFRLQAEWEEKTAAVRAKIDALMAPRMRSIFRIAFERYPDEVQAAYNKTPSERTPIESWIYHRAHRVLAVGAADGAELLKSEFRTVPGLADFRRVTPDLTIDGYTWVPRLTYVGQIFLVGALLLGVAKLLLFLSRRSGQSSLAYLWRWLRWASVALSLILVWSAVSYGQLLWTAARYVMLKRELAKFDHLKPPLPVASAMIDDGPVAPSTSILALGVYNRPMDEVQPGFLSVINPDPPSIDRQTGPNTTGRRRTFANWLASPQHPLTARVMVNRIWHHHFGRGLVATPNDFGRMGNLPTHPELLDWLAATFVESGWSIKRIHRLIVLSHTYRQDGSFREVAAQKDSQNNLLWRFNRRRLEGEAIRDIALQASGRLNLKVGGPGFFPPLPAGMEVPRRWQTSESAETYRRSVYMFVKRNTKYPLFEAFDVPSPVASCGSRYRTVTVLQAFELMNSDLMTDLAQAFAGRVLQEGGRSEQAQIEWAYRVALGRSPEPEEQKTVSAFLHAQGQLLASRPVTELRLPDPMPVAADAARAAAIVDLCHMLMNTNEFVNLD